MNNSSKVYVDIVSELDQIFAELGMGDTEYRRGAAWLKALVLFAVDCPKSWQKGHLELLGKMNNITRERVRVILWRTAAEKWNYKCWEDLCERFGYSVEVHFEIASKPNTYEFVALLADNLRMKYQIRPKDTQTEEEFEMKLTGIIDSIGR